jgi:hypothetical protein
VERMDGWNLSSLTILKENGGVRRVESS